MSDYNEQARTDEMGAELQNGETAVVTEEFKVSGEAVVAKVKEIIREGNVRRIAVKNEEGKTVFEIPFLASVAVLFPPVATIAALGVVGALIANLTLTVERRATDDERVVDAEGPQTT